MKKKSIVTEIKKKMKKVTSIICATAMLIGSLSAMPAVTSKAADTDFQMRAGASIRLNAESTGIRFAVEIGDTVKNILFTGDENLTLQSNVEVGMLVVPKWVLEPMSEGTDYLSAIETTYGKTKEQIATIFSADQFKEEKGKLVATAAIVKIKDSNFAREYQAVAFYSTDGGATYTYTAKSDARTIGYVADSVLKNDVQKDYTGANAGIAGQLLAKYIQANRNYDLSLNMNSGDSVDLSKTYVEGFEGTSASQYTYTVESGNDTVSLSESTLTATQAGTATVLMQAYGDLINLELQVTVAWPTLELAYRYGTNKLIQVNTNLPSSTSCANFTAGENGCNIDQSANEYQQIGWVGMDNVDGTIVLTLHFNAAFENDQTYILKSGSVFGFTDGNSYTLDKDYVFTWDGSNWTTSNTLPGEEIPTTLELTYRWGTGNVLQVNTNLPVSTPLKDFLAGDNGCNIDQSASDHLLGYASMANADGTIVLTLNYNETFDSGEKYILKKGSVFGFTDGKSYTLDKDYVFTWDGSIWTMSNEIPAEPATLNLEYRYGANNLIQVNTNLPSTTPLKDFTAGDNGCNIDQSANEYQQVGWVGMDNVDGTIVLTLHFNAAFENGQTYILKSGSVFGFTDGNSYTLDKDYVFTWDGSNWTMSNELPAEPAALELAYRYGANNVLQVNTDLPSSTPLKDFLATENGCNIDQSDSNQQVGWIQMLDADGTIVLTFHFNSAFEDGQTYILKSGSVFVFTDGKSYTLDKNYVFTWDGSSWTISNELPMKLAYRYGTNRLIQVNTDLPSSTPLKDFLATDNGCNIDQSDSAHLLGYVSMANADGTIVLTLNYNETFASGDKYILKSGSVFGFTDGNSYKLDKDYVFTWNGSTWAVSNKLPTDVDENARFLTFADLPVDGTKTDKIAEFKALGFTTALVTEDYTGSCLAAYRATVTNGENTVTLAAGQQELSLDFTGYTNQGEMLQIKTNLPTDGSYSDFLLSNASEKGYTVDVETARNIGWFQLWKDPNSKDVYLNPHFSDYFKDGEQFILKAGTTFTVNGTDYVLCKDFIATIRNNYLASIQNLYNAGLNVWIRNYANKPGYFTDNFTKVLKKYENEISGFYIADEAFDTEDLLNTAGQNSITTSFDAIQEYEIPWFIKNFPNAYFHTNQVPLSSYDHYGNASEPANTAAYASAYSEFLQHYTTKILNNLGNAGKTICYDNYPFVKKGRGGILNFIKQDILSEDYLFNMLLAAKAAKEAPEGTNFGICVQTFSSDYNRDIESAEDVTFQLYNGIAMGADMFEYFAYNSMAKTDSTAEVNGIMKDDTKRIYDYVKAANDEVFPYATVIKSYDWQGIQLSNGTTHDNATAFTKITDANATLSDVVMTDDTNGVLGNVTSSRDAVIGCFKKNGKDGYMVVNYNDPTKKKYDNEVSLTFSGYNTVTVYTSTGSKMQKETVTLNNGVYTTTIEPGNAFFVIPNA